MKLFHLVLTLVFILLISGYAIADQASLNVMIKGTPGVLGHWAFEGNYSDLSENGKDCNAVGEAGAFNWVDGVNRGKAISINSAKFKGSFINITAPIGSIFDTPTMTAIVWVKLNPRSGDYWQAIAERSNFWYIETEAKPAGWKNNSFVFRIYDPVAVGGGGSGQIRDDVNVVLEDGKWYQLGVTYDGKVAKSFVNGGLVLSINYTGGLGPVAGTPNPPPADKGRNYNLSLGTWQQRDDWFDGAIDDFVYFKTVLTEAKIKSLYDVMLGKGFSVSSQSKITAAWGEIKK